MPSLFIVLDGPDGSGTTRHADMLTERLLSEKIPAHRTAEPSNGPVGSGIRAMLQNEDVPSDALQLLFTSDRADHLKRDIEPALKRGEVVVCDRYLHSTYAYGEAVGLDREWLRTLNKNFMLPSCTIFALPPFSVCQERLAERPTRDRMETNELQRKVYDQYVRLSKEDPSIHVIDTSGSREDVHEEIWKIVQSLLTANNQ